MTESRPAPAGWRRAALPASLILNLFLLALIGGHGLHRMSERAPGTTPLARALARAEASLPPRDAAAFGAAMHKGAPRFAEAQKRLTEARMALEQEIAAEPFDPAATRQALAAFRTAWDRFFEDFSDPLVDGLTPLSAEGRRKLIAERQSERR